MNLIQRTWPILATVAGLGLAREIIQRSRAIDLHDKVVLITGGSRGLGLAVAQQFAQEGAHLVLCARDEAELKQARVQLAEFGAQVLTIPCDVANDKDCQHTIQQAIAHFGHVDILVNNAGVISAGPWQTLTRADFEESMNIIFWGTYNMTMAALPHMTARKEGRIVNITSIGGKVSVPHLLAYSSAKFAAVGFSEGLRAELAKEGIVVTTVAPGLMRTGSQSKVIIKGEEHKTEYSLFVLLDALPVSSISVRRAARQIVHATKLGQAELIISIQAQLAARLNGAFPGVFQNIFAIANRFLPDGEGQGTQRHTGADSETTLTRSPLTALGQKAARDYNEEPDKRSI